MSSSSKLESLGSVFDVIIAEQTYETVISLDGPFGFGRKTNFLLLQAQHHHTIEGIEAGFNLVEILVAPLAQLYDERQHLVIFGIVDRNLVLCSSMPCRSMTSLSITLLILRCPPRAFPPRSSCESGCQTSRVLPRAARV